MAKYYVGSAGFGENELYHFGVKGMKWGVRRYQNEDGTLTAEGRARYLGDGGLLTKKGSKTFFKKSMINGYESTKLNRKGKRMLEANGPDSDIGKAIRGEQHTRNYTNNWSKSANRANQETSKQYDKLMAKLQKKHGPMDDVNGPTNPNLVRDFSKEFKKTYDRILLEDFGEHPVLGKRWVEAAVGRDMYDTLADMLDKHPEYR